MMMFWIATVVMVIVALTFVVTPLLWSREVKSKPRQSLNVAVYEDRLWELNRDQLEGDIGKSEYLLAKRELERDLYDDLLRDTQALPVEGPRRWWRTAFVLILIVPILLGTGYWRLGSYYWVGNDAGTELSLRQTLDEVVMQLSQRVSEQPADAVGWDMLGQAYLVMKSYEDAVNVYQQANALVDDSPDLLAGYAEALWMAAENGPDGPPPNLIKKALALDPGHPKSLWLSGIGAYQRGSLEEAMRVWQELVTRLPVGSESAETVKRAIAKIQTELADRMLDR